MLTLVRNVLPALLFVAALISSLVPTFKPRPVAPPLIPPAPSDPATFVEADAAGYPEASADPGFLRFVALGDTGKGNAEQFKVAAAMKQVCDARGGCAFGVLLGDNLYPSGADSVDDPAFEEKFEKPYSALGFPFWVVLGNHDCGGNGNGLHPERGQVEVAYSRKNPRWRLPAPTYAFKHGPAEFIVLDTNALYLSEFSGPFLDAAVGTLEEYARRADAQRLSIPDRIAKYSRPWRFVLAHHPWLSTGVHGDAGGYDGVPAALPGSGATVRTFFERTLCEKVDVFLSAHDHSLQDHGSRCGVEVFVSGGGAQPTRADTRDGVPFSAGRSGFLLVEARRDSLDAAFFGSDAQQLHVRRIDARTR